MVELFRSPDLLVRQVGDHGAACCVVTFDSFTDHRTLDRPGFGEAFLDSSRIDAIHVIARDNDWYQDPGIMDAMAEIRSVSGRYDRVVAYGSSMGGYAALRLGGMAGAQAALALSPQFSIDPAVVPWEKRWPESSKQFIPVWEGTLKLPILDEAYVAYDPVDLDRRHAGLFAAHIRFTPIRLPHCGHPVTGVLAELGLLQTLIRSVCGRDFDAAGFERDACAQRERSPQYLISLANSLRRWRRTARVTLMQRAVALAPMDYGVISHLANELREAGRLDEALALHRRALEIAPSHPHMLLQYSYTLERSGDLPAALAMMEAADACAGGTAIYQPRLARLQAKLHRRLARRPRGAGFARWFRPRASRPGD